MPSVCLLVGKYSNAKDGIVGKPFQDALLTGVAFVENVVGAPDSFQCRCESLCYVLVRLVFALIKRLFFYLGKLVF